MSKIIYAHVTVLDIVVALVILLVAIIASRFVAVYLRRILKETIEKSQLDILIKVIRYGIIVLAVLFILPTLVLGLWLDRPRPLAALCSMVVGTLVALLFQLPTLNATGVPAILPALGAALLAYFIGHVLGRERGA